MDRKTKIKYRVAILGILFLFLFGASLAYVEYVKDEIPDTIYIDEHSDGTINFDLPFVGTASLVGTDLNAKETSINLNRPLTIYSGDKAEYSVSVKLLGFIDIKNVKISVKDEQSVIAGGIPVGIYIKTEGVLVVDIGDVASGSGDIESPARGILMPGDYIIAVNGEKVGGKEELINLINQYGSEYVAINIRRNEEVLEVKIKPEMDSMGMYRIGAWVRDDCQGLGTLTYVDTNGNFGTLGHAISDSDTGKIIEIESGRLYTAKIWSVIKGKSGTPGEVIGSINYGDSTYLGAISENKSIGIYGTVDEHIYAYLDKTYMNIAYKQDVQVGRAYIRTFIGDRITDYEIYIYDLNYSDSHRNKGIEFTVTDEKLLNLTNGIVQGMSGSPIIQNGKIVGAVTHVFVNEPQNGYGIFIENMLEHK
ncbi:MAG: SpoIVB peptidase [Butyrivibrio sp.]